VEEYREINWYTADWVILSSRISCSYNFFFSTQPGTALQASLHWLTMYHFQMCLKCWDIRLREWHSIMQRY